METLPSCDNRPLERKSSIYQHKDLLSVMKRGEWCPLVADVIDAVACGKIYSHKAAITDKPTLGYTFPVGTCRFLTDIYLKAQFKNTITEELPEWFGTGYYKKTIDEDVVVNAANGALGTQYMTTLRVGEDYVVAKDSLPPVE